MTPTMYIILSDMENLKKWLEIIYMIIDNPIFIRTFSRYDFVLSVLKNKVE